MTDCMLFSMSSHVTYCMLCSEWILRCCTNSTDTYLCELCFVFDSFEHLNNNISSYYSTHLYDCHIHIHTYAVVLHFLYGFDSVMITYCAEKPYSV